MKQKLKHWHYCEPKPFTKEQRAHTTVLFGGLTFKHERILKVFLKALGYNPEILPDPSVADFQIGKEYGNYGQCNPTYFTVGNLVNYLKKLESEGLSKQEIVDKYVFITASSPCGPCRFGMYQNEYRLAVTNAGFEGFRILTFEQSKELNQSNFESGLEINTDFFLALIHAFNIGDLLNEIAYSIRPYEVKKGETDKVLEESIKYLENELVNIIKPRPARKSSKFFKHSKGRSLYSFLKMYNNFFGKEINIILKKLEYVGECFDKIEIDRTKVKPVIKIVGEFWAQTTEGDGNFKMFSFLEREGGAVLVEPVATWISYLIHKEKLRNFDNKGIIANKLNSSFPMKSKRLFDYYKSKLMLNLADKVFNNLYKKMSKALGGIPHDLVNQEQLAKLSHEYYNTRASGGEGHLEVGKSIYYYKKALCHMILSLKPFGCMPSTQSDGAQAAVQGAYGGMVFLPIETSGEGEINAHSRVQMTLGEAKRKTRDEFQNALEETNLTEKKLKCFIENHPELKKPSYKISKHDKTIGVAANTVYHIKKMMDECK